MFKPFELVEPTSLEEAIGCLDTYPDEARIYAGGSELLLVMRLGLLHPRLLVNIKNIAGMDQLELDNGNLKIGSLVTHRTLETSTLLKEKFALIGQMESKVANVRVRNVGTLGGNLAFAEPHSDPATLFLMYEAQVVLQSSRGRRQVPLEKFFTGPYETVMEPSEILIEIRVPGLPQGMQGAYIRWGTLERPTLNIAVGVQKEKAGLLSSVRIAIGSAGPVPVRMPELEQALRGMNPAAACTYIGNSDAIIRERLTPVSDLHGSEEYKVYLAKTLLQKALREAAGETENE